MRQTQVIKSLFWELRAAGVEGSARDVLRLAHFLLRSHNGEVRKSDDFGRVVDSRALPFLPVDVVMADGGWRILEFENSRSGFQESDDADQFAFKAKIKRLMGSVWRR